MPEELRQNLFLLGLIIFYLVFHVFGFFITFLSEQEKSWSPRSREIIFREFL